MKSSNIGGQAVLEGVMMRNKEKIAVAVRKPDGGIRVGKTTYKSASTKYKFLKWPIIRGCVSFVDSLIMGIKTLMYSADVYASDQEEEKEKGLTDDFMNDTFKEKGESAMMIGTVAFSLVIAVALFIILPYFLSSLLMKWTNISSNFLLALIEGIIKILIFIGYIAAIAQMKDIKRTFMYHGAEHKCINCIESGLDLTVDNVMKSSKEHRRCGTSFIFIVLFISIIFFMFIRIENIPLRIIIRLLLIPVIAGVSYEFIKWAGNSDSKLAEALSKPGLWMQGFTTKEPTRDMVQVGIASVISVFDWKPYVEEVRKEIAKKERREQRAKEREEARLKGISEEAFEEPEDEAEEAKKSEKQEEAANASEKPLKGTVDLKADEVEEFIENGWKTKEDEGSAEAEEKQEATEASGDDAENTEALENKEA